MARKRKQVAKKPEGGIIRMGPIVWTPDKPAKPRKVGGVVIMGPIKPEGGDK